MTFCIKVYSSWGTIHTSLHKFSLHARDSRALERVLVTIIMVLL